MWIKYLVCETPLHVTNILVSVNLLVKELKGAYNCMVLTVAILTKAVLDYSCDAECSSCLYKTDLKDIIVYVCWISFMKYL